MDFTHWGETLLHYAWPVLLGIIIFLIGRKIAGSVGRVTERTANRSPNMDKSLSRFIGSAVRYVLLFFVIMIALSVMGVDTSGFTGMIAGLGVAMAFILQGSLSNVAAGVMLMLFRPFKIGDEIQVGDQTGAVTELALTATKLKTVDNVEIIIANGKIWGGTIRNNSALNVRRLDRVFHVDFKTNIDQAFNVITAAAAQPRVLASPAPWAKVVNIGDSSIDIELRVWCNSSDYRALGAEIAQPVKAALDKAGIHIPYATEVKIRKQVNTSKGRDRLARSRAAQRA